MKLFFRFILVAISFVVLATYAYAGKISTEKKASMDCRIEANTVAGQDGTKALGQANFCVPKASAKMSAVGEKKQGFGDGVADVPPGFMPPPGSADYGVESGDKYFWTWSVNNTGTVPVDSEFLDKFSQNSNIISAHYVKGPMPAGQLPWPKVISSQDATVSWAMPANNAEVVLQIKQAPPGPGYVVLVLQMKKTDTTVATPQPGTTTRGYDKKGSSQGIPLRQVKKTRNISWFFLTNLFHYYFLEEHLGKMSHFRKSFESDQPHFQHQQTFLDSEAYRCLSQISSALLGSFLSLVAE